MVVFEPTRCTFARWAFTWGGWLLVIAGAGTFAWFVIATSTEPQAQTTEPEQPFAQVGRRDYHTPVWSLSFSADGSYLAAATLTGEVWLEERATGRVVGLERRHRISVRSLSFAPVGHVLAVVGDLPAVRLWDAATDSELATIEVESGFTRAVAFSADGAMLAVSERRGRGEGGVVSIWDWRKPCRIAVLAGHRGEINALACSRDGSRLASADSQGFVKVWDLATRRERMSIKAHEFGRIIQSLAFSPDGTLLIVAVPFDREVSLWDAASGAPRGTLPTTGSGVHALAFAPDGPMLAMARGDGAVSLWDIVGRREMGILRAGDAMLQSLAFSPDGRQLATGGTDGAVRLWDMARALGGGRNSSAQSP
jgi:hypothetical protein